MKKYFLFISIILFWVLNVNADNQKEIDFIISEKYSWIEQFYKKDLKDYDIEDIKIIYNNFNINLKKYENWEMNTYHCDQYLLLNVKKFYNDLNYYIDKNKINDYEKYIKNNSNVRNIQWWDKKCRIEFELKYKEKINKSYLTEKQKELIKNKIEKLDNNKIKILNEKLDSLLKTNLSEKKKNIVLEIKEIISNYENNDYFINNIFWDNNTKCSWLPWCDNKKNNNLPNDFTDL